MPETLFDSIAKVLPEEQRESFFRCMAHMKNLHPNDELLHIAEAMGLLTLLTRQTPAALLPGLERAENALERSTKRLAGIPEEIVTAMDINKLAANLAESLRQKFIIAGVPQIADDIRAETGKLALTLADLRKVEVALGGEKSGVLGRLNACLNGLDYIADKVNDRINTLNRRLVMGLGVWVILGFALGVVVGKMI